MKQLINPVDVLTPGEVLGISLRIKDPQHRLITVASAYTGMRITELLALDRDNVNRIACTATVDPDTGTVRQDPRGRVSLVSSKTCRDARTVDLPPFLVGLLKAQMAQHGYAHVFATTAGDWLRPAIYGRAFTRAADEERQAQLDSDQPRTIAHALRHTHIGWLAQAGVRVHVIRCRLGLASPRMPAHPREPGPSHRETTQVLDHLESTWATSLALHGISESRMF